MDKRDTIIKKRAITSILSHKEESYTEELLSQFLTQITQKTFIILTSNVVFSHRH